MKTERILPPYRIIDHIRYLLNGPVKIIDILAAIANICSENIAEVAEALHLGILQDKVFIIPDKISFERIGVYGYGEDEYSQAYEDDLF
jgi:hypothetical protein